MTRDDIITLPDPRLRQKSQRIGHIDESTKKLAELMLTATLDWESGRQHEIAAALAAIQIGEAYRVVIIRQDFENIDDKSFAVFVNPEIVKTEGEPIEDSEGCLSVAGVYGLVKRYPKVKVKALNLDGQPVRLTATGFLARVFQHEIDHLNGLVFVDHVENPKKLFRLAADGELTPLEAPSAK